MILLKPHFLTLLHFRILSIELVSHELPSNLKNNPLKYQRGDVSDSKVSLTTYTVWCLTRECPGNVYLKIWSENGKNCPCDTSGKTFLRKTFLLYWRRSAHSTKMVIRTVYPECTQSNDSFYSKSMVHSGVFIISQYIFFFQDFPTLSSKRNNCT